MAAQDDRITLTEAAEQLGVHYMTVYRYVRTGRLAGTKDGVEWRVDRRDVAALRTPHAAPRPPTRRRIDHASRLEDRLVHGDEAGAWAVTEAAMGGGMTPDQVYADVIAPAMTSIGSRWEQNTLTVDQEHLASNVVLRLIGRMGPRFTRRGRKRGTAVLGAPPGDAHSIPLALAADLLRVRGFEVVDLGADVPAPSFGHAVRSANRLVGVGVCATTDRNEDNIIDALTAIRAATQAPVVLGGGAVHDEQHAVRLGATWFTGTTDEMLRRFDAFASTRSG